MSQRFTLASSNRPTLFLLGSLVLVCAMSTAAAAEELLSRSPERGGIGLDLQQLQFDEGFIKSFSGRHVRGGLLNKLDERLSLIVTDKASTSAITFSEVMDKLAADMAADSKLTSPVPTLVGHGQRNSSPQVGLRHQSIVLQLSDECRSRHYRTSTAFLINVREQKERPIDSAIHSKPKRMDIQRLRSSTALIWQTSKAASTAVSSGSFSPKTVGLRNPLGPKSNHL